MPGKTNQINQSVQAEEMRFGRRDIIRLIVPLIIEQTLAMSVGMIDTIMVSHAGGSAVSGVSLVESINILLITLFTALATGGAIVAGQYLGKRDRENSSHAAKQLVITTFFLSLLIMLVCLALNRILLSALFGDVHPDVMANARSYFFITALSYPGIALFNAAAALFRSTGNTKVAMFNALIMNLLNIGGNAVFIYGFGWGAFGAGLATTLARSIGALTMLCMLRSQELPISVRSYSPRDADFSMIRRILRIGIPNGLENSMFQIGKIAMTSLVASYGTAAITAYAVGNSLAGVEVIPGQACGLALTTIVAQCVGAGEYDQANRYMKLMIKIAIGSIILLNLGMLAAMQPILGLYRLTGETYRLARLMMMIHGVSAMVFWTLSFTLPNAFRAAGDVKFTMVVSILSMWLIRVCGAYLLAWTTDLGVLSVWVAMIVDWIVRGTCFVWRWASGKWRHSAVV